MSSSQFENPQALIQQVMQAANAMSDQEAAQRYQQILAQLPQDQAAELNALALSQVDRSERQNLAGQFRQAHNDPHTPFSGYDFDDDDEAASPMGLGQLSARAQQQDPALLGGIFGGNNPLGGQIGKAALAALAMLLIRQMMGGQQSQNAGGLGGLGGLGGQSSGMGGGMGGDMIGSILGSLLGSTMGGGMGGNAGGLPGGLGGMGGNAGGLPGGLDLGSILSSVLGSGSMARQAPQGGGLGGLLGSLLGGGNDGPSYRKDDR